MTPLNKVIEEYTIDSIDETDSLDQEDLDYFKESKGFKKPLKTKFKNERYKD